MNMCSKVLDYLQMRVGSYNARVILKNMNKKKRVELESIVDGDVALTTNNVCRAVYVRDSKPKYLLGIAVGTAIACALLFLCNALGQPVTPMQTAAIATIVVILSMVITVEWYSDLRFAKKVIEEICDVDSGLELIETGNVNALAYVIKQIEDRYGEVYKKKFIVCLPTGLYNELNKLVPEAEVPDSNDIIHKLQQTPMIYYLEATGVGIGVLLAIPIIIGVVFYSIEPIVTLLMSVIELVMIISSTYFITVMVTSKRAIDKLSIE